MKFKHAIDAVDDYDRTQISYADIEVTISVEEIKKLHHEDILSGDL